MSSREERLGQAFVELADTLVTDFDPGEFLYGLSHRCVELLDVDAAGLLLADPSGDLRVVASSSEEAHLLELFEVQNEEGPCLDCYRTGAPVAEAELEKSTRWPRFRKAALQVGFRSVQAAPMRLRDEVIGALNLFRSRPGELDPADIALSKALADVATIGLLQERSVREARLLAEQLQTALNNRVLVEQAKGVLAARTGASMVVAFEALRSYARRENRRLAEVASALLEGRIAAGDLTPPPG